MRYQAGSLVICRRHLLLAVLLPGLWMFCSPSAAKPPRSKGLVESFPRVSADHLIARLEGDEAPVQLVGGAKLVQQRQWSSKLNAVVIESELQRAGASPLPAQEVVLCDWTFRIRPRKEDGYYERLTHRQDEWYESTYWTGPDWTRVGKTWHHPGKETPSVRCFRAPRQGRVTITGRVFKLHEDGDGVRLSIRHGLKIVWQAKIDGADAKGVEPNLTLDVGRGDRLRFAVDKGGEYYCDTTHWDPVITYADGERFQASDSFAAKEQGAGHWYYELEKTEPLAAPYEEMAYDKRKWYDSTFWTGPDWTRVGKNWHHPGEKTPSVRRFHAPADGQVTISGRVYKLHQKGDGVRLLIFRGEDRIWEAKLEGADGEGTEPELTLDVRKGDNLRFVVDKRGGISCDTTFWDPVISYKDGPTYRASEAFSDKQGNGNWFYEMLRSEPAPVPIPTVYAFGPDLSQRQAEIAAGQAFVLTHRDGLPVMVIADGQSESGILCAMEPAGPWSLRAQVTAEGTLRVTLKLGIGSAKTGDAIKLPSVLVQTYTGRWWSSLTSLAALGQGTLQELRFTRLATTFRDAHNRATAEMVHAPELALLLQAQAEWYLDDKLQESVKSYSAATMDQLKTAGDLIADLKPGRDDAFLTPQARRLAKLAGQAERTDQVLAEWRHLYLQARLLKRDVALSNPLLSFQSLLFCKRVPPSYSHLVGQYYGWRQRPGGGLYILEQPGTSLKCRSILKEQLPPGSVLEPRLSYDGKRIVFSYVICSADTSQPRQLTVNERGPDEGYFHIYEINVDGSGLRQLTRGCYDDMMPVYLPDGGIAFCSSRRRGYSRCFGGQFSDRWDSYTLHRMDGDGSNLRVLSLNDVSEWFPAVSNSGHLLFARWDYIDRDAVTHQNLWAARPDGTNPIAVWGNANPAPHCTFQARPIPESQKIAFIASAHHSITAGPLCILDPAVDANSHAALTRLTPGPLPEAESRDIPEYYNTPWPLSEDYFLIAYSRDRLRFEGEHPRDPNPDNALGLYLLDTAGNRELIYRDARISSSNPTPLRARPVPPVVTNTLAASAPPTGEMIVTDIYQGLGDVPRGAIKALRIVQLFPKTTPLANNPRIGLAGEENGRAILGTVPVEPDGSARFLVPANKQIFFQVLDEHGFAYQTMRSSTYVQAGERTACIGCHEHRAMAPPSTARVPRALLRKASTIEPGKWGGRPFSFVETVQPVLDRHCLRCHNSENAEGSIDLSNSPHNGFTKSYWALCEGDLDWRHARKNPDWVTETLVPRFFQRNQIQMTPPGGKYGALGSRLMRILRQGHEDVKLAADDLERLATWIDLNAIFYGIYDPEQQARQFRGELVAMPEIQ